MLPPIEDIEIDRIHGRDDKTRKSTRRDVDVDMNPMVDLAFLLLTFFMLATTFSKPQAMELLVPAKPDGQEAETETPVKESKTLSLVLHEDKIVWYRGITDPETFEIEYENGPLLALLRSVNTEVDGLVVLVKPLPESNAAGLVAVLDALNVSGVQRYALSEPSELDLETENAPVP
ncbi:MAG: ExbD/TolR family protein [Cryomorphaceae bacterium]|nr:biopolymer transporter ExbD [Flavobacteriales bacterium]